VKQVYRPKLILGNAIRPAEVVRLSLFCRIFGLGVLQVPEDTVDFLLCEDAIESQSDRASLALPMLSVRWGKSFSHKL
jgi:hypothetical protein